MKAIREDLEDDAARGLHLLATKLAKRPGTKMVLLVDQFEELFTQTPSEDERRHFLDLLLTASTEPRGPAIVLLTLRTDFYDRPMRYPQLHQLIQAQQASVLPMAVPELREVIEKPAALPDVQLTFEGDLVGDLLFEVQGQAGALPLLQFTLDQLFQRRSGRQLTLSAYRELGGVKGALTRKAEETYTALSSDEQRKLTRALFVRLIDPGVTEQDTTRRRAALSEFTLADANQTHLLQEVAAAYIAARLLTTNEISGTTTIEVSHEALIREWPRLAGWLREAREDIRLQQTISEDTAEWEQHNKPGDRLYRGSQLKDARSWARRNTPSDSEMSFLHASAAQRVRSVASITVIVLLLLSTTGGAGWFLSRIPPDPTRVSTLQDTDTPGSLRYAVNQALPKSTITFDTSLRGTILLMSGDLNIARDLEILGPGADKLSISGGGSDHIIRVVQGATVTISGLTFTGIIDNEGGTLTLNNSIVSDNTANHGGGIYNNGGTLNLNNSIISDNTANDGESGNGSGYVYGVGGGGIYNSAGTLVLSNSILSGNIANGGYNDDSGGGIYNSGGMIILIKSIMSGNTANGGDGGGIYNSIDGNNDGGMITLSDSTISDNTAYYGNGGGIFNTSNINPYGTGIVYTDLTFSTIYDNTAHGGDDIAIKDVTTDSNGQEKPSKQVSGVKIRNSIVASNLAHPGPDISGTLISSGYNLFQHNSGATFDPATPTQHGTDKMLSVNDLTRLFADPVRLQNNGGPTKTLALAPDSPAVDQIPLAACHITVPIYNLAGTPIAQDAITTDQRGMKRLDGNEDRCDIGAYEYADTPT